MINYIDLILLGIFSYIIMKNIKPILNFVLFVVEVALISTAALFISINEWFNIIIDLFSSKENDK